MLSKLLALKKRREDGIRKEIGAVKMAIQSLGQRCDELHSEQMQLLDLWQAQRAAQGQMSYAELTTWLQKLQTLQKQYADIDIQRQALEKEKAECNEMIITLQNGLRLVINSQEKLNYMICEQRG